jgi:hypothetical protein
MVHGGRSIRFLRHFGAVITRTQAISEGLARTNSRSGVSLSWVRDGSRWAAMLKGVRDGIGRGKVMERRAPFQNLQLYAHQLTRALMPGVLFRRLVSLRLQVFEGRRMIALLFAFRSTVMHSKL